jgi:hypothetical protein
VGGDGLSLSLPLYPFLALPEYQLSEDATNNEATGNTSQITHIEATKTNKAAGIRSAREIFFFVSVFSFVDGCGVVKSQIGIK